MNRISRKRETDQQILTRWIEPGCRVLDLGCGRGILLQHLMRVRGVRALGVDTDPNKILGCVKRRVPAYQGDIQSTLREFPDGFFDWVVCSRTIQELGEPGRIIAEALRVGRSAAFGFVNFGFWTNRLNLMATGTRIRNEVYPQEWYRARPSNPVSVNGFERYCRKEGISIRHRVFLKGDWRTPCHVLPNLRAGYALYEIAQPEANGTAQRPGGANGATTGSPAPASGRRTA
jgi:methionine biosynthesis protein MetW